MLMERQLDHPGGGKRRAFPSCGILTGFLIALFGGKKKLPAFLQPAFLCGPRDSHVAPVLEWKGGKLFPVLRIGFRTVQGGDALQLAQDGEDALVIPVFYKARQVGRGGGRIVRQVQMVVKDMELVPDQVFRDRVLFQKDVPSRNLLGVRDMDVFPGNASLR